MHLSKVFCFQDSVTLVQGNKDLSITDLTSDSRQAKPGCLFAAISGNKVDGHSFIDNAISKGAVAILTDRRDIKFPKNITILFSDNVRGDFAKACAKFWPSRPSFAVAVTGTNGKTSTVEFLRQIWERNTWNAVSLGTLGIRTSSELNLPFSSLTTPPAEYLFSALHNLNKQNISYLALEASSHGLAQERITGLNFQAAVFTNLGRDHLDYHNDVESYFKSKEKLFLDHIQNSGHAVINIDDRFGRRLIRSLKKRPINIQKFGEHRDADFRIQSIKPTNYGLELNVLHKDKKYTCPLGLTGTFQAKNALAAAIAAYLSGLPIENALRSLSFLSAVDGRMQAIHGHPKDALIVIDYAHTPDALEQVLISLKKQTAKKVFVVFGCGGERDKGKRILMGKIAGKIADKIIVTDDNPRNESPSAIRKDIIAGCPDALQIANRDEAIEFAIKQLQTADSPLIAGKGHENLQLIGSETLPFNDAVVARNSVMRLRDNVSALEKNT